MSARIRAVSAHLGNRAIVCGATSGPQTAPDYTYTRPDGILTPQQRQDFEENGFLIIKNLVSQDKLDAYRKRFEQICSGEVDSAGVLIMKDVAIAKAHAGQMGENIISKITDFFSDEVLFSYCTLPEVTKYVTSIIGPDCMAMNTMLINKPPDPGTKSSRHPMHQDLHYFPFRPANKIVCSWTAMEKVHRDNGCLVVVPGTHKGELKEHAYPEWEGGVNFAYHGIKSYNPSMERLWLEMEAGDTVFFHPVLFHGSGTNITKGFRKAISCHYASSDCEYIPVDGSMALVADEFKEMIAKKVGKEIADGFDYRDFWRYRGRLVCGNPGTL